MILLERVEHEFDLGHRAQQILHALQQLAVPGNDNGGWLSHDLAHGRRGN
jgi:hypothetical protein